MGTRGLLSPERAISSKNLVAHMAPFLIFILASVLNAATSTSLGPSPSPATTTTTTSTSVCHLPMVHHLHLLLLLLLLLRPSVIFQWRMLITLVRPVSVGIVLTDQPVLRSTADADQPGIILRQRSSVKKSVRVILSFYMQIHLLRPEATFC